jgi:hypothetical protein
MSQSINIGLLKARKQKKTKGENERDQKAMDIERKICNGTK